MAHHAVHLDLEEVVHIEEEEVLVEVLEAAPEVAMVVHHEGACGDRLHRVGMATAAACAHLRACQRTGQDQAEELHRQATTITITAKTEYRHVSNRPTETEVLLPLALHRWLCQLDRPLKWTIAPAHLQ
jgi:hypothetical protein